VEGAFRDEQLAEPTRRARNSATDSQQETSILIGLLAHPCADVCQKQTSQHFEALEVACGKVGYEQVSRQTDPEGRPNVPVSDSHLPNCLKCISQEERLVYKS
jgi:hypothetical protein